MADALAAGRIYAGCAAADGAFACVTGGKPATTFLFDLIARLRATGWVPPRVRVG